MLKQVAGAASWWCASGRRVVMAIGVNVAVCAGLFSLLEHTGYFDGLYWAVTTASTAGYGDLSPATVGGRITSMWLMVSSVALIALATARLAARLVQDPHLFSHEEQEELKDDVDDVRDMLTLVCEKLDIPVPESVEEYHQGPSGTAR
ncbi:potassium channel family protein [Isoptericola jiangsuensis]|uniref:potassium channel family protein n=1 Tax=Isoptericola jiangsuensis TaxID=548579 RepID=UPI003AAA67DC